jgi:uncharacterized lipoprotein YmbA
MARTFTRFVASSCIFAVVAGCGSSPPSRYYTLEPTAKAEGTPAAATFGIAIGQVAIPAAVDRPQFVVQVAPNRVALDEFERWAAPLEENIARVVAGDLATLLGAPRVTTATSANADVAFAVAIDVQRFDSIPGEAAVVEAYWSVRDVAKGQSSSGRTVAREAVKEPGFDALAAAHSRALGKLSADIAAAIRALAGPKQ